MANFQSVLDRPASSVERPKPLPAGSYLCIVFGRYREDVSSKKGTPFVEFTLKPTSPGEDVDSEALKEALTRADGTSKNLTDQTIRATFYVTNDAIWRLKNFLKHLGVIEDEDDDRSLRILLDETPNRQVIAILRHKPTEDGESTFAEIAKTAPAE